MCLNFSRSGQTQTMSVREVVDDASVPPFGVGDEGAIVAKPRAQRMETPLAWEGSPAAVIVLAVDDRGPGRRLAVQSRESIGRRRIAQ